MKDKPVSATIRVILDDEQIEKIKQDIVRDLYVDTTEVAREAIKQVFQTLYDGIAESETKFAIFTLDRIKELAQAFGVSIYEEK